MENKTTKTVKVSELKAGDDLGNCIILSTPVFIGDYCGQKNKMQVKVRFLNGTESVRIWGKYTTVKINAA